MKASGKMTKLMASASMFTLTAQATKATGEKICNMAMERRFGLMALALKGSTSKGRSKARASSSGQMVACTRENSTAMI